MDRIVIPCSDDDSCRLPGDNFHQCLLCTNARSSIVGRLDDIDQELSGKIMHREVAVAQLASYKREYEMTRQGIGKLTVEMLMEHYEKHRLNTKGELAREIMYTQTLQTVYREKAIGSHSSTQGLAVNRVAIAEWLKLSKHKVEMLKTYNVMQRHATNQTTTQNATPYEFN